MAGLLRKASPEVCARAHRLITTAPTARTPAPTASLPKPATLDEPHDDQQHDRTDRGVDDRGHEPGAEMDPEARYQPASDEGAEDADHDVTKDAKPGSADDLTG